MDRAYFYHRQMIARYVAMIDACEDREDLVNAAVEIIGHDEIDEETDEEFRAFLVDYCKELCVNYGVHCADVGIHA